MSTNLNWKPVIKSLLEKLVAAGYRIARTDNGEDSVESPPLSSAVDELTACDEANLWVWDNKDTAKPRRLWIRIVLGNAPDETVSDYVLDDDLDKLIGAWSESWENRRCPLVGEPDVDAIQLALQDAKCILQELAAGNAQRTRAIYWLQNNAALVAAPAKESATA